MRFKDLARQLAELEMIASRNQMTVKLAELLKKVDLVEVEKVVYLLLGSLRPDYERLEFNLAEKQMQKAIARASGKSEAEVRSLYKKRGDLGLVAEELGKKKDSTVTVKQVFERMEKIALDEGAGSQERKLAGLADLVAELDRLSAKFAVRVVLGKLRLGFSDKTILDAISWMVRGDKSAKNELKSAYQVRPDVGWLAKAVRQKGIKQTVTGAEMRLGVPVSPMLCQRLKSPKEMIEKMGRVAIEPKFDGTRVQIHFDRWGKRWQVRTFTRNLEETSHMFPELTRVGEQVKAASLVLDSEAVGFNPKTGKLLPFQLTITRKRKHGVGEKAGEVPVKFFVFDVLYKDGRSLVNKTYEKRRQILKETVKDKRLLVVDDYWVTEDPEEIRKRHKEMLAEGLEGVVVKQVRSQYVPGRTGWRWVKMKEVEEAEAKLSDTVDCVVMGFYRGRGKRVAFGVGAFLAGIRKDDEFLTITKVGTKLTDEQFRELKKRLDKLTVKSKPKNYRVDKNLEPDVWVEPKLVVELAADEVTKSPVHTAGVALRFPKFIRFRDDKGPDQTTSLAEVRRMR